MEDLFRLAILVMWVPLAMLPAPFLAGGRAWWGLPLVYAVIIPLFTVPAHLLLLTYVPRDYVVYGDMFDNMYRVSLPWALLTLLPGVAHLGPFLWLLNPPGRRTRSAARLAGFAGAVRFLVPVVLVLAEGTAIEYQAWLPLLGLVWPVSLLLWVLTLAVIEFAAERGVFRSQEGTGSRPARAAHAGGSPRTSAVDRAPALPDLPAADSRSLTDQGHGQEGHEVVG